jgi:predicted AlkP superfamily phosphohydrolase/phosphomutase
VTKQKKTLLAGFDAACWEYLDPLLQAGRLPTLQRLMASGTWGTLHSTMPAMTPVAWASIITGKNPGKHGVYDMTWRRPGTYEFLPTSASVRRGTPFWQRLNEQGIRVGLVNVPFTYPPGVVDGFLVCGFGTPTSAQDVTYPRDVLQSIEAQFGPYQALVPREFIWKAASAEIFEAEQRHQTRQVEIAAHLAEQYDVDVLIINLMLLDHANHYMPGMEQVEQAIRRTDADLGALIQAFRPDRTFVISDHGFRRVHSGFLLYAWLRDLGFCAQIENTAAERSKALNSMLAQWLQDYWHWSGPHEKATRHLTRRVVDSLPRPVAKLFWQEVEKVIPFARDHVRLSHQTDYSRTQVFPGSTTSGALYLNVAGREPSGVVLPEDRARLQAGLVERLSSLVEPETGRPLFRHVFLPADLYTGAALESAPDLILDSYETGYDVVMTDYAHCWIRQDSRSRYMVGTQERRVFGQHSREGIFVFSGKDSGTGPAPCEGHVMDVPATVLYLYNVPIPEDYDGCALLETIDPELVSQHPVSYQQGDRTTYGTSEDPFSAEEVEELLEHLEALGYVG